MCLCVYASRGVRFSPKLRCRGRFKATFVLDQPALQGFEAWAEFRGEVERHIWMVCLSVIQHCIRKPKNNIKQHYIHGGFHEKNNLYDSFMILYGGFSIAMFDYQRVPSSKNKHGNGNWDMADSAMASLLGWFVQPVSALILVTSDLCLLPFCGCIRLQICTSLVSYFRASWWQSKPTLTKVSGFQGALSSFPIASQVQLSSEWIYCPCSHEQPQNFAWNIMEP